jgi:hypothetical protein
MKANDLVHAVPPALATDVVHLNLRFGVSQIGSITAQVRPGRPDKPEGGEMTRALITMSHQ